MFCLGFPTTRSACGMLLGLLFCFASIVIAVLGYRAGAEQVSLIEVSQESLHDRKIKQGDIVSGIVRVTNAQSESVEIRAKSGCDCTVIGSPRQVLAPRESTDITVAWNPKSERGRATSSVFIDAVCVALGVRSTDECVLSAEVEPDLIFDVAHIVVTSHRPQTTIHWHSRDGIDVKVKEVYCTHPAFTVDCSRAECIDIWFDESLWERGDRADAELRVISSSANEPECVLPFEVRE